MKISSKTRYALRTILDLALHRDTGVIKVTEISKRQHVPQKFLEQILLLLKGGGLVGSKRGAKGGYFLALPPAKISISMVVRLTEESLFSIEKAKHDSDGELAFEPFWKALNDHVVGQLESTTIQDICDDAETLLRTRAPEYSI